MANKRELIETAEGLGLDIMDADTGQTKTKSQLTDDIEKAEAFLDNKEVKNPEIEMPPASEGKTTSEVAAKTDSKLKATTRPSDIVKIRQGRKNKSSSEYPKHLPHGIMQPGPHGLSTGG